MDFSKDWLTAITLEHACKKNFESVIKILIEESDLFSKIKPFVNHENEIQKSPQVKSVFIFIALLKKFHHSLQILKTSSSTSYSQVLLPIVILLKSAYQQYNFMSAKKFLHFISEVKLLDLMNLLITDSKSSDIIEKLNFYFPRWNLQYRELLEKEFNINNSKVFNKIEESHTQCRRLILKLAVDPAYRSTYMADQYSHDVQKIIKESEHYITEIIRALEQSAGESVIEKILNREENPNLGSDLSHQLLLDYLQPNMSPSDLLGFLNEMDSEMHTQYSSSLTSCLLPFDSISDASDSDAESEESSQEEKSDAESA